MQTVFTVHAIEVPNAACKLEFFSSEFLDLTADFSLFFIYF